MRFRRTMAAPWGCMKCGDEFPDHTDECPFFAVDELTRDAQAAGMYGPPARTPEPLPPPCHDHIDPVVWEIACTPASPEQQVAEQAQRHAELFPPPCHDHIDPPIHADAPVWSAHHDSPPSYTP